MVGFEWVPRNQHLPPRELLMTGHKTPQQHLGEEEYAMNSVGKKHRRHLGRWAVLTLILVVGVTIVTSFAVAPRSLSATAVTVTPPATWTGGVPTADYTPDPEGIPTTQDSFWDATATGQPQGQATATSRALPTSTP